ncbi:MAG: CRISPR-associated ring nuclease [Abditibacteriales bacterium]|nr:CRISPR-associated ring nuclease [Abditibacteriales bacterium]MDW8365487.1 CRISPR-associated ring nuclease [Abditibacteriales bacterium]
MRSKRRRNSAILIATLGSEPQVITLALDCLRARGHDIGEVVVVHTAPTQEPIRTSFAKLKAELPHYKSLRPPVAFHFVPIKHKDGTCPADITTEQDAGAVFSVLYREVLNAKRHGRRVHLSVAGGRKVMSVYGMAVAQLLFDGNDCLWHVLSEGKLLADKRMHAEAGDELILIPVPVLRWSSVSPALTLSKTDDPMQAFQVQQDWRNAQETQHKREFLERVLTPAERELLTLLAREGLSNTALAARLRRSPRTVAHQLTSIYAKFTDHFSLDRADRSGLIAAFAPLLSDKPRPP